MGMQTKLPTANFSERGANVGKETRHNKPWREDEDSALLTMRRNKTTQAEMALALGRTKKAVQIRLSVLRSVTRQNGADSPPAVVTVEKAETDLSLLLWFVKEAWVEGHAIVIPALGATIQNGKVIK